MDQNFFKKKVESINVKEKTISELLSEMSRTGFQGRKLGEAVETWLKMLKDDVTIIMGYAGSMSTTGMWKIICWLMEKHYIDVLVPTGANVSEDIVEAMGYGYWQGHHVVDDIELRNKDINRYYDVYGSEKEYLDMIELIADFYNGELQSGYNYSSRELLYHFGQWLKNKNIECISSVAAKNKIPIFCPAIIDSAYGDAALISESRGKQLIIDQAKDYSEFMSIANKTKDVAVIYLGGGVPKDFIQLLAVSSPLTIKERKLSGRGQAVVRHTAEYNYPHKYAIQITTDSPQWGGLSGCTFEEAMSWAKISEYGQNTVCYCDITLALPLIVHALNERIGKREKYPDFSWLVKEQ